MADSDLGDLPVTVAERPLPPDAVAEAALSPASEVAVVGPLGIESAAAAGRTWTAP